MSEQQYRNNGKRNAGPRDVGGGGGNSNDDGGSSDMPPAPYPPMISSRYPSTQLSSLRSSLSSTPHYSAGLTAAVPGATSGGIAGSGTVPKFGTTGGGASANIGGGTGAPSGGTLAAEHDDTGHRASVDEARRACRIEFCGRDLLASINTNFPGDGFGVVSGNTATVATVGSTNRKRGPILLELRRLVVNKNSGADGQLFSTNPLCVSRSNPSLGTSLSSSCLQVAPAIASSSSSAPPPPCATGLTTGALCIHTFHQSNTEASAADWDVGDGWSTTIEYYHTPRYHRPATAVAWRPATSNRQVAIGLVASSSVPGDVGGVGRRGVAGGVVAAAGVGLGGGASGGRSGTGDREHCCFIWDVEHQSSGAATSFTGGRRTKSTPLFKLSHQIGVASLGWLMDGQTLAVGGQMRNLQLYDLRVKGTGPQQAPVSVYAHNFGVHGIEPDPTRPWQFATYCRAANEPVKIWDARRMDSIVGEIRPMAHKERRDYSGDVSFMTVSAVKWSMTEPGHVVVAVGDAIHDYDITSAGSRPTRTNTVYAKDPVIDLALYPYAAADHNEGGNESLEESLISEYFPKRMVTVHSDGSVRDMARHTLAPVAVSHRDGRVVHAFGRSLWIGPTNQGPSAMESLCIDEVNEDVSAKMMRRARCQIVSKVRHCISLVVDCRRPRVCSIF